MLFDNFFLRDDWMMFGLWYLISDHIILGTIYVVLIFLELYASFKSTTILRLHHHLQILIIKIVWPNMWILCTIHLPSHDFDFEHACSRKRKICTTFKNRQRTNFKVLLWYSMWSKGWKGYRVTWLWVFNHKIGDNLFLG